jgi:hypothetical protein
MPHLLRLLRRGLRMPAEGLDAAARSGSESRQARRAGDGGRKFAPPLGGELRTDVSPSERRGGTRNATTCQYQELEEVKGLIRRGQQVGPVSSNGLPMIAAAASLKKTTCPSTLTRNAASETIEIRLRARISSSGCCSGSST